VQKKGRLEEKQAGGEDTCAPGGHGWHTNPVLVLLYCPAGQAPRPVHTVNPVALPLYPDPTVKHWGAEVVVDACHPHHTPVPQQQPGTVPQQQPGTVPQQQLGTPNGRATTTTGEPAGWGPKATLLPNP
jgi:hypothetical protein